MNKVLDMLIIDNGGDYYTLQCKEDTFGRMYDNNATYLKITFPSFEKEKNHECKLVFYEGTGDTEIIDQYPEAGKKLKDGDVIPIKNTVTQKRSCYIKFEFSNSENTYFKNTEIKKINFAYSIKPKDFNPTPENLNKLTYLWNNSHVGEIIEEIDQETQKTNYIFKNSKKETISTISINQSDQPIALKEKCFTMITNLVENEELEIDLGVTINTTNLLKILVNGVLNGTNVDENVSIINNKILYKPSFTGDDVKLHIFYYTI